MEGKDASCLQKFEMNGDNLNMQNVIDDVLLSSATGSALVENHSGDEDAAFESMFERRPGPGTKFIERWILLMFFFKKCCRLHNFVTKMIVI